MTIEEPTTIEEPMTIAEPTAAEKGSTGTGSAKSSRPVSRRVHRRQAKKRLRNVVVQILALAFFFGPTVAYVAGGRPHEIENRALAAFPSLRDGWKALPKLGVWATEHLVGRDKAISLNQEVNDKLFHEQAPASAGNDQVLQGRHGWLYYAQDITTRCGKTKPAADTMKRMQQLSKAVTRSGRKFVVTIAPDKSDIYPQFLPKTYVGRDCAPPVTQKFWSQFDGAAVPGYLDVRTPLQKAARDLDHVVYRPRDTHWSALGSSIYAQLLAARLDPVLSQGTTVPDTGKVSSVGDLTYLLGRPQKDTYDGRYVTREGVTMSPDSNLTIARGGGTVYNTSTGPPLYQPKTLILGDSFTDTSKAQVVLYFRQARLLNYRVAITRPTEVANAMIANDTVIWEVVERDGITGNSTLLQDPTLKVLIDQLASHPLKNK